MNVPHKSHAVAPVLTLQVHTIVLVQLDLNYRMIRKPVKVFFIKNQFIKLNKTFQLFHRTLNTLIYLDYILKPKISLKLFSVF